MQSSVIHRKRNSPTSEGHGEGKADTAVKRRMEMRGHRKHWDLGPGPKFLSMYLSKTSPDVYFLACEMRQVTL